MLFLERFRRRSRQFTYDFRFGAKLTIFAFAFIKCNLLRIQVVMDILDVHVSVHELSLGTTCDFAVIELG